MRDTMLRQQRDFEFFKAYQKALEEQQFANQREAIDYVRTHEAPRWFVSKEHCAAVLSCMARGMEFYKMGKQKKRKFTELFRLYALERREHPNAHHLEICETIVNMPAPEWYLEHQIASRIITEQITFRNNLMSRRYGRSK
jgi:hypothetical protein